jgi:hypothetical protein
VRLIGADEMIRMGSAGFVLVLVLPPLDAVEGALQVMLGH